MSDLKIKNIECESITLTHPESKAKLSLAATPHGAGIWVSEDKNDKAVIAIYTMDGMTAVGIYGPGQIDKGNGLNVALSVDKDGNPYVQVVNAAGDVKEIGYDELARLAK